MIGQQQRNQSEPFLATISDAKTPKGAAGNGQALGYAARIVNLQDYYPFGMLQPGRQFSEEGYGYGFNGMERDDEVAGEGNSYTAEFWQYDARLGRRWNLDPKPNVMHSQYSTFQGNPIRYLDSRGDTVTFSGGAEALVMDYVNPESNKYDKSFAERYHELDADKAEFHYKLVDRKGGTVLFDGEKIIIEVGNKPLAPNLSVASILYEETEHATQLLYGEYGFVLADDGTLWTYGLEQVDETNGFLFGITADGVYNTGRVKKMNTAIANKDHKRLIAVSTSRHPDYALLPISAETAEGAYWERTRKTIESTSSSVKMFLRPFKQRVTPLQTVLQNGK